MKLRRFAGILIVATLAMTGTFTAAAGEEPGNMKFIPHDDPDMAAAAATAEAGLDDFLAKFDNPPSGTKNYNMKIGIIDQGDGFALIGRKSMENAEYFWLGNLRRTADGFRGTIANQPGLIRNVRAGQEIAFTKGDIFDWMYVRDGKIVGNVTACPLLRRGPKEELEFYRQNYGLEC